MSAEDIATVSRNATLCTVAVVCVLALCATLFFKNYADPTVLVAIIGATNFALGYLAGKKSPQPTNGEPKT